MHGSASAFERGAGASGPGTGGQSLSLLVGTTAEPEAPFLRERGGFGVQPSRNFQQKISRSCTDGAE